MLPNFRICDCCGKTIDLDDGQIHTEWSGHAAYCKEVPIENDKSSEGCCLIDFVFERRSKGASRTVVPHDCKADLCDGCKLMLLENAASLLRSKLEGLTKKRHG